MSTLHGALGCMPISGWLQALSSSCHTVILEPVATARLGQGWLDNLIMSSSVQKSDSMLTWACAARLA